MRGRHLTTAITLLVLVGLLALGTVVGVRSLFAPLPGGSTSASPSPACATRSVRKGQRVSARQVQVSVFNSGTRAGLADETMAELARRGFKRGDVGNAPSGRRVKVAQVWTTQRHDPGAHLVAHQFGGSTKVRFVRRNLGPGVDVIVGSGLHHLAKAKGFVVAKRSSSVCVPATGAATSSG